MSEINTAAVKAYLKELQDRICVGLGAVDSGDESAPSAFLEDAWTRQEGGGGRTRLLREGAVFEQAGVNFSHVTGSSLPPAASAARPELAGRSFEAMGVSLVVHPNNPYVPTSHANVRYFVAEAPGQAPVWWFGGGFDLTPYYGFEEDAVHWHQVSREACEPFGAELYPELKRWCDDYFYIKHRGEHRGVGGLFFDDLNRWDFDRSFAFMRSVGDHYLPAYLPIVERRRDHPWGEAEKHFQRYRRGRYVEFNLVYDRGTIFGLQTGGRTESILMSLPPDVRFEYCYRAPEGTPERALTDDFLRPRDWLGLEHA